MGLLHDVSRNYRTVNRFYHYVTCRVVSRDMFYGLKRGNEVRVVRIHISNHYTSLALKLVEVATL
jgi:hypothetical protein